MRTAVPYLLAPAKTPCDDEQQSEREQDALPALEVGEQGVVEDLARGAEDRARELVDEQLAPDREAQGQQDSIGGEHRSDEHAHPWATSGQHEGEEVEHGDDGKHPDGHRVAEGIDGAELLELVGLHQHDLPVRLRDRDVLDQRQSASDEPLLHLLDDLVDVEHELVALDRDGPRPLARQDALQRLLRPDVDLQPQLGELVRGDEGADLPLHEAVDGCRQGPDQLLQPRPLGDHALEDVVEDRLDVDLLLDGVGHLGGDGVLHLGRVDQRIHGRDVPLGVVQGALAPVRDRRGCGQEPGQHQAEDRRDRASPRRSLGCWHGLHRSGGRVRWRELRHGFSVEMEGGLDPGSSRLGPERRSTAEAITSPGSGERAVDTAQTAARAVRPRLTLGGGCRRRTRSATIGHLGVSAVCAWREVS